MIAPLIRASSDPGELVFDPFLGSGTTAVVARALGRDYLGIEREERYLAMAVRRLRAA
jgi:site-specific DNA-methyltransferase (adenine-specific)